MLFFDNKGIYYVCLYIYFRCLWTWECEIQRWSIFLIYPSQLTVACIKMNRPEIASKAIEIAERRLSRDKWPEYYDTKKGRFIGKQARLFQTWSIAGYLVGKLLLAEPSKANILITAEDSDLVNAFSCMISSSPKRKRGQKNSNPTYIV